MPQTAIVGVGTKVVIQTETIGGTTFNYYRKLTVYTTMYKPCDYEGNCWYYTSNRSPVQKGVIAVYYDWYYAYEGQQVYVTDYGTALLPMFAAAVRGCPFLDRPGYSEDEYEALHLGNGYRVMYFLAP